VSQGLGEILAPNPVILNGSQRGEESGPWPRRPSSAKARSFGFAPEPALNEVKGMTSRVPPEDFSECVSSQPEETKASGIHTLGTPTAIADAPIHALGIDDAVPIPARPSNARDHERSAKGV